MYIYMQAVSTHLSFLFLITMTHTITNMTTTNSTTNRIITTAMAAAIGPEFSGTVPGPPDEGPRSERGILKCWTRL